MKIIATGLAIFAGIFAMVAVRTLPWWTPTTFDADEWVLTGHRHLDEQMKYGDEMVPVETDITDGRGSMTIHWDGKTTTVLKVEAYRKTDGKVWIRYTAPDGTSREKDWKTVCRMSH